MDRRDANEMRVGANAIGLGVTGSRVKGRGRLRRVVVWHAAVLLLTGGLMLEASPAAAESGDSSARLADLNHSAGEYTAARQRLEQTEGRIAELEARLQKAPERLTQIRAQMSRRASALYQSGQDGSLRSLLQVRDPAAFMARAAMLDYLGRSDAQMLQELGSLLRFSGQQRERLSAERARAARQARELDTRRRRLETDLRVARAMRASRIARHGTLDGFVFPVLGRYAFSNDWGQCRAGCRRRHVGTDIFSPYGTPLVAVLNGHIMQMQTGGAGGIMLWIRTTTGDVFFYAHLSRYAQVTEGQSVRSGDVVGYVGNSGNAKGGPAHLHFEYHPGGGAPV
ncbi:MAG: peptidoglycan DD-metalloendopeptidase family protein, partial [Actinomycetota bacterium]